MSDPWKRLSGEVNVPIVKDYPFKFTRRWFVLRNQTTFSTFLPDRFPSDRAWKGLQIGVFEGQDLVWQMQNIYSNPGSRVIAIDPWVETTKLDQLYMDGVRDRAHHNLRKWRNQITLIQGFSQDVLAQVDSSEHGAFDLIIIDGDHNADAVYQDAVLSYKLARRGAWLLFDDVRNRIPKKDHVKDGLERFLKEYEDQVERVWEHRFCDCLVKVI